MKNWITACSMAFGMFSAIPFPLRRWDENQRGRMLVLFPWVGAVIGALWALAAWIFQTIGLEGALSAALLTAVPLGLTGFIHLDGFMDCCDAIYSRRDLETRRKILKDSHCGAFAVIHLALYLLLFFAAMHLAGQKPGIILFLPASTRCVSALAVCRIRPMQTSQYASKNGTCTPGQLVAIVITLVLSVLLPVLLFGIPGACAAVAAMVTLTQVWFGVRQLGGMSGDISGFAITRGELAGVMALAILIFMEAKAWF